MGCHFVSSKLAQDFLKKAKLTLTGTGSPGNIQKLVQFDISVEAIEKFDQSIEAKKFDRSNKVRRKLLIDCEKLKLKMETSGPSPTTSTAATEGSTEGDHIDEALNQVMKNRNQNELHIPGWDDEPEDEEEVADNKEPSSSTKE